MLGIPLRRALLAVYGLDAHSPHQPGYMSTTDGNSFPLDHVAQHACAGKRTFRMKAIDHTHEIEVALADRLWGIVQRTTANIEKARLVRERKVMITIDHRFTLGTPMRPSAFSKKSFSNANWPIFACNSLTSIISAFDLPPSNAAVAFSSSCVFHCVMRFGWRSKRFASSATV